MSMPTPIRPTIERFWPKVEKTDTCWLWTASLDTEGYGQILHRGRTRKAHRVAWELLVGPLPDGNETHLDHLCRVRRCVNPDHLELVTRQENILRGTGFAAVNARKTHCVYGHEYTPENTIMARLGRECRACRNERQRLRRQRLKIAASV